MFSSLVKSTFLVSSAKFIMTSMKKEGSGELNSCPDSDAVELSFMYYSVGFFVG